MICLFKGIFIDKNNSQIIQIIVNKLEQLSKLIRNENSKNSLWSD